MPIIALHDVESRQIHSIGYDPETQTLAVRFARGYGDNRGPGSLYHYANVPQAVYEAFAQAESKGNFFNTNIKPQPDLYPYQKVVEADGQQQKAA